MPMQMHISQQDDACRWDEGAPDGAAAEVCLWMSAIVGDSTADNVWLRLFVT